MVRERHTNQHNTAQHNRNTKEVLAATEHTGVSVLLYNLPACVVVTSSTNSTQPTTQRTHTHLSRDTVGQCRGFLLSKACGWSPSPPVLKGFLKDAGDMGRPGPPKRLGPRSPRDGTGGRLKVQPVQVNNSSSTSRAIGAYMQATSTLGERY